MATFTKDQLTTLHEQAFRAHMAQEDRPMVGETWKLQVTKDGAFLITPFHVLHTTEESALDEDNPGRMTETREWKADFLVTKLPID